MDPLVKTFASKEITWIIPKHTLRHSDIVLILFSCHLLQEDKRVPNILVSWVGPLLAWRTFSNPEWSQVHRWCIFYCPIPNTTTGNVHFASWICFLHDFGSVVLLHFMYFHGFVGAEFIYFDTVIDDSSVGFSNVWPDRTSVMMLLCLERSTQK